MSKENYNFPDKDGRFGDFGGKYVSETLISALDQLEETYEKIKKDKAFLKKLKMILKHLLADPRHYILQKGGQKI